MGKRDYGSAIGCLIGIGIAGFLIVKKLYKPGDEIFVNSPKCDLENVPEEVYEYTEEELLEITGKDNIIDAIKAMGNYEIIEKEED